MRGNERAYLSWFFRNLTYAPTAVTSDDIDEHVRIYAAPGAMRAGFEYYRNWSENRQIYEECPRGELSIPVLALGGTSASDDAPIKTMQAVVEGVQRMTVEQAGHYLAEESRRSSASRFSRSLRSQTAVEYRLYEYKHIMMLLYWIQDKLLPNAWNPEEQRTPNTVCTTEKGSVDHSPRISIFFPVEYTKYGSMQRTTQPLLNVFDREGNQSSMIPAPLLTFSTLLMSFKKRDDQ